MLAAVCVLLSNCLWVLSVDVGYETKYIDQYFDHLNYVSFGQKTFKQRYLIQDRWWKQGKGPIFFYTGNEGDITDFWKASGFITDIAPQFGALVVFGEHRFYGKSLPAGKDSFKAPYIGLLTMEQAMGDYALLLTRLKEELNAANCPVIAFGGSYGGMLSAYMRFKYPNIITGAIAASAPIYMLDPSNDRNFFFKIVTEDFQNAGCADTVRQAFSQIASMAAQGAQGLKQISKDFSLCKPITNMKGYKHLLGWVRNAFATIAMFDYPYPTTFFAGLSGNPVNVACDLIKTASDPVIGLAQASGLLYNGTHGKLPCFDIWTEYVECADPTGCGIGLNSMAWDFQACTEVPLPAGTNNVTDMFPVLPFTPEIRKEYCQKTWGVTPRDDWPWVQFWGTRIKSTSNIVFSNGNLDPWHGGGVLKSLSSSVVAVLINGGAHHLDLRHHNPKDPPGVIQAREIEKSNIQNWVNAARRL